MKKIMMFSCAILVIALVAVVAHSSSGGTAKPGENKNLWDFKTLRAGDIAKHYFPFKNETKNVVHVLNVTTSCGCTTSSIQKKVLLPGEETFLEVRFDSKGFEGDIVKVVYVVTDEAERTVSQFTIKAHVVK